MRQRLSRWLRASAYFAPPHFGFVWGHDPLRVYRKWGRVHTEPSFALGWRFMSYGLMLDIGHYTIQAWRRA